MNTKRSTTLFNIQPYYRREFIHLWKIPLFLTMILGLGAIAWNQSNLWIDIASYFGIGYLLMGMATFYHEATHNTLFKGKWKNWAFGIIGFFSLLVSYVSYRDDHLIHHRNNRTPSDTAAFTMGRRSLRDFIVFYAYIIAGLPILFFHFNFVHPFLYLKGFKFWLHWIELTLHGVVYGILWAWAVRHGSERELLEVCGGSLFVFGLLNSVRFLCEHHGTPWNRSQISGTRTVISNRLHSWFWNNINFHIGHHVYPAVPFYNLKKLHQAMLPRIEKEGGVIENSYVLVFLKAMFQGPETPERANRIRIPAEGTSAQRERFYTPSFDGATD